MDVAAAAAEVEPIGLTTAHTAIQAHPWARFWARNFDVTLTVMVLTIVLGRLFPRLMFTGGHLFGRFWPFLFELALFPAALALDGCIQAALGQTPGKAIAGIRVEKIDHGRLSLRLALRRSALVYLRGFAGGLPIITLGAYWSGYDEVRRRKTTSWDRELGTRVFAISAHPLRTWLTAILVVAIPIVPVIVLAINHRSRVSVSEAIARRVEATLPAINGSLPKQVDRMTRLDGVGYSRRSVAVTYTYSLLQPGGLPDDPRLVDMFKKSDMMKPVLRQRYCQNPAFNNIRRYEIAVHFLYLDSAGGVVKDYLFTPEGCRGSI